MTTRVLFYAQYLKGIGHVVRARRIVEELAKQGADVTLVLGGPIIPDFTVEGARIVQLPPVMAGSTSYSTLFKPDGVLADEAYLANRRAKLLATSAAFEPQIIITEAFPMGRWAMRFELEPLLEQIAASTERPRPLVLASLRDILQMPKKADKARVSIDLFERFYDFMLVHGDQRLVALEESFPPLAPFIDRARYTGIVAPKAAPPVSLIDERFDVLVSAGGGAIGYDVLSAAIRAKPSTSLSTASWLALAGPRMTDADFAKLDRLARDNDVELQRFRDDLANLMVTAKLSIQRAGYNTIADLLRSQCRAVLVPDAANRQMEQPLRAEKLEEAGRAIVVAEDRLSSATMVCGIERAMATVPKPLLLDMNGGANSAQVVFDLWRRHQLSEDRRELD